MSTELEDARGSVVALLQAVASGDGEGFDLLLSMLEGDELRGVLCVCVGVAERFGTAAYGDADRFAQVLAAWTPGTRLGDPPGVS